MAFYRCGGGGIPSSLKTDMNAVFNKKFGTAVDYPPEGWPDDVNLMGPLPEKTIVSSPIADFSDGADDVPTKSLVVTIPPTISGVSSVTETQTGRNLFDNTGLFPTSGSVSSYYFKQFDVSSGNIPEIHLKAGVTYTFAVDVTSTIEPFNFSVGCGNGSYSTDILTVYNKNNGRVSITFTPTTAQLSNGDVFAFRCPRYQAQNTFDYSISNAQLEYGSTAHAYEPYQTPTTYTASLGRTIYGGTADIVNGTGTDENGNDFTFTGQEVPTRLGYNAFWSDEGDTEVTYRADINLALGGQ